MGDCMLTALVGPRGTGKTQMAAELGREAFRLAVAVAPTPASSYWGEGWERRYAADKRNQENVAWAARWVNALDLFADLKTRNIEVGESAALAKWARPALLVIDEIQERGDTEFESRMLTNLIDKRYGAMKDTLIIGNLDSGEFQKRVGASIVSRMIECGGISVCNWPSFRKPKP